MSAAGHVGFRGRVPGDDGSLPGEPDGRLLLDLRLILSAGYALWLYARVIYGKLEKPNLQGILDLDLRMKIILAPLVA